MSLAAVMMAIHQKKRLSVGDRIDLESALHSGDLPERVTGILWTVLSILDEHEGGLSRLQEEKEYVIDDLHTEISILQDDREALEEEVADLRARLEKAGVKAEDEVSDDEIFEEDGKKDQTDPPAPTES